MQNTMIPANIYHGVSTPNIIRFFGMLNIFSKQGLVLTGSMLLFFENTDISVKLYMITELKPIIFTIIL